MTASVVVMVRVVETATPILIHNKQSFQTVETPCDIFFISLYHYHCIHCTSIFYCHSLLIILPLYVDTELTCWMMLQKWVGSQWHPCRQWIVLMYDVLE
jgi:hypothetical protein